MLKSASERATYSLILPVCNEELVLPTLLARLDALLARLDGNAEVIFVDDGSKDKSAEIIEEKARLDDRYRLVYLSRNFGHQIAITAGMDLASGDAVIIMDADLQDPPELVLQMVERWKSGFEIVYAKRSSRQDETYFKRWTAGLFYRLLRQLAAVEIPPNVGDLVSDGGFELNAWARRFRDVLAEITNDLGGPDVLSEAHMQPLAVCHRTAAGAGGGR